MGCVLSSASQDAEADGGKSSATGRTAPDILEDKSKHRSSRSFSMRSGGAIARRKVFSGSQLDPDDERKAPRKLHKSESERNILREALREGTLLGALGAYELGEMIDYMEIINLKQGQDCDLRGCLCVMLEGEVQTKTNSSPECSEKAARRFLQGAVFGQVGLFDDSQSTGGLHAIALKPARICKLQGTAYRRGMEFSRQAHIKANMKLMATIPIFSKLSTAERLQISDSSEVKTYLANDKIITEGEPGEHFYILRSGGASVSRGLAPNGTPNRIDFKYPGDYFGEAALLEGQPRNATIIAAENGTEAMCISRAMFNKQLLGPLSLIMQRSELTVQQQMLTAVPLLSQLTAERRNALTDRLKLETFADGSFIFKQGDNGNKMYIIKTGQVSVELKSSDGKTSVIDNLLIGQYFGERSLVKEEPRMASTRAKGKLECYSLSKQDFDDLALVTDVAWSRRWDMEDTRDVSQLKAIKSIGAGAFGKAWLVKHVKNDKMYALKALDKHTVKRQNWTGVVMREKDLLLSLAPHPCVITMHNAFQSPTQLFMLMDVAMGGELFQVLEKFQRFEAEHARFYAGCVTLAVGHLHKHGIIFRDLKPENLLLTSTGYLKLIDFGFAKRLGRGDKTYTLCGTPYYLAPEMILHRGHDFALDWWTVGVLIYEMLEGEPPFTGNSEVEVYGKVTRLQYSCTPVRFPDAAIDIIAQLLSKEPETRLGNMRNGVNDVMAHRWFHDFSWDDLYATKLPVPYLPPRTDPKTDTTSSKNPLDLSAAVKAQGEFGYWPGW